MAVNPRTREFNLIVHGVTMAEGIRLWESAIIFGFFYDNFQLMKFHGMRLTDGDFLLVEQKIIVHSISLLVITFSRALRYLRVTELDNSFPSRRMVRNLAGRCHSRHLPKQLDEVLGLPVGKHIFLCAKINDKLCMRAYTPTSSIDEVLGLPVVKIYFKGVVPKFPNGRLMSQYLDSLPLGSSIDIKGPLGHIEYTGKGNFMVHGKNKYAKKLMQAILKDQDDETEMFVVYANRTEDDILLKDELDAWAEMHPERVKVWYVVSETLREGWKYSIGFITESILREHMPEASADVLALACGPPQMIQFAVNPNLEKMGYDIKDSLLVFWKSKELGHFINSNNGVYIYDSNNVVYIASVSPCYLSFIY